MMGRLITQAFICAIIFAPFVAVAEQALTFGVPQSRYWSDSRLNEEEAAGVRSFAQVALHVAWLDLQSAKLAIESRVPDTGEFKGTGIPSVGVTYLSPVFSGRLGGARWRAGLGIQQLSREASSEVFGREVDQRLTLLPGFAGIEVLPFYRPERMMSFFVGSGVSPTLMLLSASAISDGKFALGFPLEHSLGFKLDLGSKFTWLRGIEFDHSLVLRSGGVAETSVSETAFRSGVRVSL